MIMNPSFYKSIYTQEENQGAVNKLSLFVKRHFVKVLVSSVVFILVFTSFLMMGTDASSQHVADATDQEQVVLVHSGDTLWAIAKRYSDSKHDIRYIIYRIQERNDLKTAEIKSGQKLVIPTL
ncbi:cell division suppressor protein YneA [Paenibacillus sinopodophylli]|uniref:cell division suppressor protein YneA n=1 Tax=Paenibacillus sinopodophylli TaxID=1837342 RepID=UPI00110CD7BD|nr:LysM peptidoglycan-binding domain-containing protein [Paenibacillus sinopodophylli]